MRDSKGIEYDAFQYLPEYAREKAELSQSFILRSFELNQITEGCARQLMIMTMEAAETWSEIFDKFQQVFDELAHVIQHKPYYEAIERYEKGSELLEKEESPALQAKYRARLAELAKEIERLKPKGETA